MEVEGTAQTPIKLYRGEPEEYAALELLCSEWSRQEFWPAQEFKLSLRIPRTFLLYLKGSERWQGIALGRMIGDSVELYYIYVTHELRGLGQGERLLQKLMEYAIQTYRAQTLMLEVRAGNRAAIALYEKLGFSQLGCRKKYYENGEDALIYTKVLPAKIQAD